MAAKQPYMPAFLGACRVMGLFAGIISAGFTAFRHSLPIRHLVLQFKDVGRSAGRARVLLCTFAEKNRNGPLQKQNPFAIGHIADD
ncbi:hypothetical protein M8997_003800 [Phyllobacterium sp. 21LDTY02-6]|nr:hypothetical protein [Phyllobacterium sp. 21LDTY02-6]